jgi:hypothetical protein
MLPVKDWWVAFVAVGVAVLLALLAQALFPDRAQPATAQAPPLCMDDEAREATRKLTLDGLGLALKAHTQKLFEGWVKDHLDQPKRASAGMQEGLHIYDVARTDMLEWNPPKCGGPK